MPNIPLQLLLLLLVCNACLAPPSLCSKLPPPPPPPPDALALLAFKSKADVNNRLNFTNTTTGLRRFCEWEGVQCAGNRAVRLVIQHLDLGGVFAPSTLSNLDQLRVLSLHNNSLTGPIPDLSGLKNLKSLFLHNNRFNSSLPPSLFSLHRLRTMDFSHNNLTGPIPTGFTKLDRLYFLRLSWNRFNGTVPPLNQSSLKTLDVSGNNLTGAIPVTPTLFRFDPSSFSSNPGLCGEIIHKECHPSAPFFRPTTAAVQLGQSAEVHSLIRQPYQKKLDRTTVIIGSSTGVLVLVASLVSRWL